MPSRRTANMRMKNRERVFLTWTIHNSCNYRCSYCFITTGWRDVFMQNTYPGPKKLIAAWDRIYRFYGSCIIKIAGGEPFTYPSFMELVAHLSKRHFLDFSSNLFWDADEFVRRVPRGAARIEPSYHPEFCPDVAEFARKCGVLKERGFMGSVHMVGLPKLIDRLLEAKRLFEEKGLDCVLLPFRGRYPASLEGPEYPGAYTEEERRKLRLAIEPRKPKAGSDDDKEDAKKREHIRKVNERYSDWYVDKGDRLEERPVRMCAMGASYGRIQPTGDVLRCCTNVPPEKRKDLVIGNFLDPGFRLLDGAKACDIQPCGCWKPMIPGDEAAWKPLWNLDSYARPDTFGEVAREFARAERKS